MEEVLEVYHRPPDPEFPVVAMDEQPIPLLKETRFRIMNYEYTKENFYNVIHNS